MIARPEQIPGTFAELHARLGGVPLERIAMRPPPGTATEQDVIDALDADDKRLFELVDGVLVEKATGAKGSLLATALIRVVGTYADERDLGIVLGADGPYRLRAGLARMPDVSFV